MTRTSGTTKVGTFLIVLVIATQMLYPALARFTAVIFVMAGFIGLYDGVARRQGHPPDQSPPTPIQRVPTVVAGLGLMMVAAVFDFRIGDAGWVYSAAFGFVGMMLAVAHLAALAGRAVPGRHGSYADAPLWRTPLPFIAVAAALAASPIVVPEHTVTRAAASVVALGLVAVLAVRVHAGARTRRVS